MVDDKKKKIPPYPSLAEIKHERFYAGHSISRRKRYKRMLQRRRDALRRIQEEEGLKNE